MVPIEINLCAKMLKKVMQRSDSSVEGKKTYLCIIGLLMSLAVAEAIKFFLMG